MTLGPRARRRLRAAALAAAAALVLAPLGWAVAVRAGRFPVALLEPRGAASVTVRDAAGTILRQQATGAGGRETWAPLAGISPHLINATLAAEDHRFWRHGGVDPRAVLRAAALDLRARRYAYGASTITMQLVRLLEGGPAASRGLGAKLGEALAAARLERVAGKAAILEQYLNRVYYGNGAWGAEAAARFYLGKPAVALSAGEAAALAVLPRSPRRYDPHGGGMGALLARRRHVLGRMQALGWLGAGDRRLAEETPLVLWRERPGFAAPHFVDHVLGGLAAGERRGATVDTTLDGPLQARLEVAVREHLASVGGQHISQAGLVVLRHQDGAVLAMVGSGRYFDPVRSGAVNVTTSRRRPGSTLKPFVYALALEQGDTPATLAHDVILPDEVHQPWTADVRQHGLGRYRETLAGSYNLAAVHTLQRVGVGELVDRLRRAGLTTLGGPDFRPGPSLAIGDAEVTLLELTAAFAAFGNGGRPVVPRALTRLSAPPGLVVAAPAADPVAAPPLFSEQVAYLIFDILADPDARRPMFGSQTPTHLPFPVALKTGTTRGYTDNLALGTTHEYTVGAWAGNFDGSPTDGVMAMQGAAPLVRAVFTALAARFGPPAAPPRPPGLEEADVCPLSGAAPGPHCPHRKRELFVAGSAPAGGGPGCTFHVRRCGRPAVVYPDVVRAWARATGNLREDRCDVAAGARAGAGSGVRIVFPVDGARFSLDPFRPPGQQIPPMRAAPTAAAVTWTVDGTPVERWRPAPGAHLVRAEVPGAAHEIRVFFE